MEPRPAESGAPHAACSLGGVSAPRDECEQRATELIEAQGLLAPGAQIRAMREISLPTVPTGCSIKYDNPDLIPHFNTLGYGSGWWGKASTQYSQVCFVELQKMDIEGFTAEPLADASVVVPDGNGRTMQTNATFPLGHAARNALPGRFQICWAPFAGTLDMYVFVGFFRAQEPSLVLPCYGEHACTAVVAGVLQDPDEPPRLFPYSRPDSGVGFNPEL